MISQNFNAASLLEISSSVIRLIEEHGIIIVGSSRLHQYRTIFRRYFRSKVGEGLLTVDDAPLLAAAIHEMFHFGTICKYLPRLVSEERLEEKLRTILKDVAIQDLTASNTPGRDVQFELFAACSFTRMGFPVTIQRPPGSDFRLQMHKVTVAAEVKRPKSSNGIVGACKKACRQMGKCSQKGVVITDLTSVIGEGELYLTAKNQKVALADLEWRLFQVMLDHLYNVHQAVNTKRIFAWVGYAQAIYLCDDGNVFLGFQWKNFNMERPESQKWRTFSEYFRYLTE